MDREPNVRFSYNGINYEVLMARVPEENGRSKGYAVNFTLGILDSDSKVAIQMNNLAIQLVTDQKVPMFRSMSKQVVKNGTTRYISSVGVYPGMLQGHENEVFVEDHLVPALKKQIPISLRNYERSRKQDKPVNNDWYSD